MIKALIFDMDDTLFDCTNTLIDNARKRAAKAMVKAGLPCKEKQAYDLQYQIISDYGEKAAVFNIMCQKLNVRDEELIVKAAIEAYNSDIVEDISLFPDVLPTLRKLRKKYKLILLTAGLFARQSKKIRLLGLKDEFDLIKIQDIEKSVSKEEELIDILKHFGLEPYNAVSIGDKIHDEIRISNQLGINTVRVLKGRYRNLVPKNELEKADYDIDNISEIPALIEKFSSKCPNLNIVLIGGGTGLPTLIDGLKRYTSSITAIVTVTDSGRSSGRLRKELNVLPPGDIRNCLIAMSGEKKLLRDLFQYRFDSGTLKGHNFGNLFIAALTKITGSFEKAVIETSKILKIKGQVLPSTLDDVHICAELEDGKVLKQEDSITRRFVRDEKHAPVKRLFLEPDDAKAYPQAVEAILKADAVIIGPGSLHVSIITNLLIKGIRDAVKRSPAKKIYVCNIVTQPFQTDNMKASDHLREVMRYLGYGVDYAVVNNKKPGRGIMKKYEDAGSYLVEPDIDNIKKLGAHPVASDLIEEDAGIRKLFEKRDLLRHSSEKVTDLIIRLVSGNGTANAERNEQLSRCHDNKQACAYTEKKQLKR